MNRCKTLTVGLLLPLLVATPASMGEAGEVVRQFMEVDTLFANPGQGWMNQQRAPKAAPRLPCSVAYTRYNWADLEPVEGQPEWRRIDEVIAAWKDRGASLGFRIMTCNAHSSGYYASPKWLFDAGCKGYEYERGGDDPTSGGKRIKRIEPEYSDPLYLAKHGAFIAALGRRYDGHPGVEFLDIGSYGIWGEWHTPHPAPVEVRKQIVDLYLQAFRKTPLVFMSDDAEVLAYALAKGTGFRRDGVGSEWHERTWIGSKKYAAVNGFAEAWKNRPVVFEWFGNYDYLKQRQWSFDAAVDFMLRNHVTLINDNLGRVPAEEFPKLEKLARLASYRFVLREIGHADEGKRGGVLKLRMNWANVGVGRLYRPYTLRICLLDQTGRVACQTDAKADPRAWLPGDHLIREEIDLPDRIPPGDYTLALALVDVQNQRPNLKLAIDALEKEGRYELSRLRVAP